MRKKGIGIADSKKTEQNRRVEHRANDDCLTYLHHIPRRYAQSNPCHIECITNKIDDIPQVTDIISYSAWVQRIYLAPN